MTGLHSARVMSADIERNVLRGGERERREIGQLLRSGPLVPVWLAIILAFPWWAAQSQSSGENRGNSSKFSPNRASIVVDPQQEEPIEGNLSSAGNVLASAIECARKGYFRNAESDTRRFLSVHADSAEGHFLLGYILYRERKPKASLAEYTLGARFRNPSAVDLASVAMDYVLLNAYTEADKWLTRSVEMDPKNYLYWYYLGRTKYTENRFQEAVHAFEASLQVRPMNSRAEYNLGLAYEGGSFPEKAEAAYRTAIAWQKSADHQDPQPYLDLGMLLTKEGRVEEAIPLLQKAVAIAPRNPKVHEELGRAYERVTKLKEAQEEFETAVDLTPGVSPLHFELGRIYRKEGFMEKARSQFSLGARLLGDVSTDSAETPNTDVHP